MKRAAFLALLGLAGVVGLALVALAAAGWWSIGPLAGAGVLVFGSYGPWVLPISAAVLGIGLLGRRFGRTALGWFVAALATVSLLAGLVVVTPQVVLALSEGSAIGPANALGIETGPPAEPDRVEVYATPDGTELRAGIWLPPREALDPGAAVLWVHGGRFVGGGFGDDARRLRRIADAGYPAISIDYRLSPPPRWRDANGDVACALGWLRGRGKEFGIDPDKIVLGGASAGGTLALNVAYGLGLPEDEGGVTSSCGDRPKPPAAVLAVSPPVDLTRPSPSGEFRYRDFLGGGPDEAAEAYAYASPSTKIRRGLPRTLIVQGDADRLVDPAVSSAFAEQVRRARNEVRYVSYPFGGHAFDRPATLGEALTERAIMRWLQQWFPVPY